MSDTTDALACFNEAGFAIVHNVVLAQHVETMAGVLATRDTGPGMRNLLRTCPAVAELAASSEFRQLLKPAIGTDAFAVRALFFDKLSHANWSVPWHQDFTVAVAEKADAPGFAGWSVKNGVVHVQAPAHVLEGMVTLRLHLDDCGEDNGAVRVIPGSHRDGKLDDEGIARWKNTGEIVTCVVPKGGVLLMRPLLLHASSPAKQPCHRRVLHIEYATEPLPSGLRWHEHPSWWATNH